MPYFCTVVVRFSAGDKYPSEKLITCLDVLQIFPQALEQNSIELNSIFLYLQTLCFSLLIWFNELTQRLKPDETKQVIDICNKTQKTRNQLISSVLQRSQMLSVAFFFNMEEEATTRPLESDSCPYWL